MNYPDTDISIGVSSDDGKDIDIITHRSSNKKTIGELANERRELVKNVKRSPYRCFYLEKEIFIE